MYSLKPGLYIVSTPIGNLQDITLRAIETLQKSQIILCEDTRVSQKLLAKIKVASNLLTYNEFSNDRDRSKIKTLIDQGNIVSLISDAGTPLISDPGFKLVKELKDEGYFVDAVPGPSSPITALVLSGLATDKFYFGGFIPKTHSAQISSFTEVKMLKATLIFFETANRLPNTLQSAIEVFGNREACIARELTKLYQDVKYGSLMELKDYAINNNIKGEIILLIAGFQKEEVLDEAELITRLTKLREKYSAKDSVNIILNEVKNKYQISKNYLYDLAKKL